MLFQNASEGPIKLIGDSLRAHPGNIFLTATSPSTIKMLMSGKYAFTFVNLLMSKILISILASLICSIFPNPGRYIQQRSSRCHIQTK
jgi:hypothetical protein